jgi:hypothetical protein
LVALVTFFFSVTVSAAGRASDPVIVLEPTSASEETREALQRIRDELTADRFDVVVAAASTAAEPGTMIEAAPQGTDRGAVIVLFGDPATGQTELSVVRRGNGRTAVRWAVIVGDPETMPERLSSRVLELLRATALELSIDDEAGPARPAAAEPATTSESPAGPTSRTGSEEPAVLAVDAGMAVIQNVQGPPPLLVPIGRVRLGLTSWLHARFSAAGLGTRPEVETSFGSATVSQSFLLLEVGTVLRPDQLIHPLFNVGSGVLHVNVDGAGTSPYVGESADEWLAAIDVGLGLALAFRSRSAAVVELHTLVALPHPVIRFADTNAAALGYPSLILSLALEIAP